MTCEELRAAGAALFGYGWQSRMAELFGVTPKTVNTWANGHNPIPEWVELALAAPRRDIVAPEWVIGEDAGGASEYVVHLASPRFIARVDDAEELHSGLSVMVDEDDQLCDMVWLELPQPEPEARKWLMRAAAVLRDYSDKIAD